MLRLLIEKRNILESIQNNVSSRSNKKSNRDHKELGFEKQPIEPSSDLESYRWMNQIDQAKKYNSDQHKN